MKKLITLALTTLLLIFSGYSQAITANNTPPASFAPMLKKVMPAVVNINVQGDKLTKGSDKEEEEKIRKFKSIGSGVIVDAEHGYIITNAHVIKNAKIIAITLNDSRRFKAKLIGADPESDIAVLQIEADNLTTLPLGNSNNLKVGDFAIAIGNPFGLNYLGDSQTATFGIVSALQRSDLQIEGVENFIQTDAAINPGNSGGALVNTAGELIGINTAILSPYGANVGIGFAIPVNMARNIMQQLIEYGSIHRGLMGIYVQHFTPELADAFGLPKVKGALVTQVSPNSPAASAGLKSGDLIQEINKQKITDASQVKTIIRLLRVGDKVSMSILRDGKALRIRTIIADPKQQEEKQQAQNPFLFGLALRDFDQDLPLQGRVKGVQITGATENSPALRAGLHPGDVIITANKKPVRNMQELKAATNSRKDQLLVQILRGAGSLYLVVK